jgi:aminoglycoside N3'-acetyltransferase
MYGNIGGSLTFLHYLEDLAESDFLENAVVKVKGENGKITTHVIPKHLPGCRDFYGYDYDYKIMKRMRELGLNFKSVKFGIGNIYLFDMKEVYEYGMKAITEDPYITLCDDPSCRFCQKYRK